MSVQVGSLHGGVRASFADSFKFRRLTKSVVLGKAKVMSYEETEEARAKRAAKEVIKGKGQCGRKRKSAALEVDEREPEPEPEVARMN